MLNLDFGGDYIKLESVCIKNFRNIDSLCLKLSDFNVFVGDNNIGKTNILMAINKILKMNEGPYRVKFDEEDFYFDNSNNVRANEIFIQLNFTDLTKNDHSSFFGGFNAITNKLSIRLEARWEEENNDAKVEIFFLKEDDDDNDKGDLITLTDKDYIPFYYIDAYRDIWRETKHSKGDLKQIFKEYNKSFLKPIGIQIDSLVKQLEKVVGTLSDPTLIKNLSELKNELENGNLEVFCSLDLDTIPSRLESLKLSIKNIKHKLIIQDKLEELQLIVNDLEGVENTIMSLQSNLSLFLPDNDLLKLELGKMDESDLLDETKVYIDNAPILRQGSGLQNSFVIALKLTRLLADVNTSEKQITNLIIAIEEPESHMHPHLQRSFIKKLKEKQLSIIRGGL